MAESISDAVRKIKQKAVQINGEVKQELIAFINPSEEFTLRVGKKMKRVRVILAGEPG
jgi:tyrosyl-tRNA synthetase